MPVNVLWYFVPGILAIAAFFACGALAVVAWTEGRRVRSAALWCAAVAIVSVVILAVLASTRRQVHRAFAAHIDALVESTDGSSGQVRIEFDQYPGSFVIVDDGVFGGATPAMGTPIDIEMSFNTSLLGGHVQAYALESVGGRHAQGHWAGSQLPDNLEAMAAKGRRIER